MGVFRLASVCGHGLAAQKHVAQLTRRGHPGWVNLQAWGQQLHQGGVAGRTRAVVGDDQGDVGDGANGHRHVPRSGRDKHIRDQRRRLHDGRRRYSSNAVHSAQHTHHSLTSQTNCTQVRPR